MDREVAVEPLQKPAFGCAAPRCFSCEQAVSRISDFPCCIPPSSRLVSWSSPFGSVLIAFFGPGTQIARN
jgi:hypothetical protein